LGYPLRGAAKAGRSQFLGGALHLLRQWPRPDPLATCPLWLAGTHAAREGWLCQAASAAPFRRSDVQQLMADSDGVFYRSAQGLRNEAAGGL
jgi:hypothetical protein